MNKSVFGAPSSRDTLSEYETRRVLGSERYSRELMLDALGRLCEAERALYSRSDSAADYDYSAFKYEENIFAEGNSVHILRHLRYDKHELHTHRFYEIICQLAGEGSAEVAGQDIKLWPGTVCLLAPGTGHCVKVFSPDAITLKIILRQSDFDGVNKHLLCKNTLISSFFSSSLYSSEERGGWLKFETGGDIDVLDTLLRMRYHEVRAAETDSLMKEALLVELFCYLIERHMKSSRSAFARDAAGGIAAYISENFRTVTLDELSREFHFTGNYISRILRRASGSSFSALVGKIRVEHACRLLAETNMTVGEVMNDSGFGCREFFYKKFREYTGMTPREWRRQNKME